MDRELKLNSCKQEKLISLCRLNNLHIERPSTEKRRSNKDKQKQGGSSFRDIKRQYKNNYNR